MSKLDKLDVIEERLKTFENNMKDVKASVEYAQKYKTSRQKTKCARYLQKNTSNQ